MHEVTDELREFFKTNDVRWICFPAYSSHRLDPLDVLPYKELKKGIRKIISDISTVHTNPAAVLDNALSLSLKSHAGLEESAQVRAAGLDNVLSIRNMFLMTESVFALKVTKFTIREGFIKAGIHPFDPVSVLQNCRDWPQRKLAYEATHGERAIGTRTALSRNISDDFDKISFLIGDLSATPTSRMMQIKTIVDTSCLPILMLEGAASERDKNKEEEKKKKKKVKRQLKVAGSPKNFPDLEKALKERKDADSAAALAKEKAKEERAAAAAAKAAAKNSSTKGKGKGKRKAKVNDDEAIAGPAVEPTTIPTPTPTSSSKAVAQANRAGGRAGAGAGAGGGAASRPKASAAVARKMTSPLPPSASASGPSPVRKRGRGAGLTGGE